MSFQLFYDVARHKFKAGDLATIVEGRETGDSLEVFNAAGERLRGDRKRRQRPRCM